MVHAIFYHPMAEEELDRLYESIAHAAGHEVAGRYTDGLIRFIESLNVFPERGSIRESPIPNLRIIGYQRNISVAFSVQDSSILVLGVFARGRNVTPDLLEERLR